MKKNLFTLLLNNTKIVEYFSESKTVLRSFNGVRDQNLAFTVLEGSFRRIINCSF